MAAISDPDLGLAGVVLRWEMQMLRLVGHLPSLRRCAHCGQEVADTPWWIFGTLASGVLCANCQAGQRQMTRVPSGAIDELEKFSDSSWRKIDISALSPQHRSVIRGVVTRYLTVLLDRKLQMHPFLEELGR